MLKYIDILFNEVDKAFKKNEVPVAALIVDEHNKIIAKAYNSREKTYSTLDHAEVKCILKANKRLKNKNLSNCTLFVTLEPCEMCKVIIREARIKEVYYLIEKNTEKKQYCKTKFKNWDIDIDLKEKYKKILTFFFKKRR